MGRLKFRSARRPAILAAAVLALMGCARSDPLEPGDESLTVTATSNEPMVAAGNARAPPPRLIAQELILVQWAQAENRADCAPLAFSDDGGQPSAARPATFSGGWAVAFDLPGRRSAYGVAGTGLLPPDPSGDTEQPQGLAAQWPYFRKLPALPQPAFAGYGVEGAINYAATDSEGLSARSLAYVRVGGQKCLYNVWSRLGRTHIERLLDGLRMVAVPSG